MDYNFPRQQSVSLELSVEQMSFSTVTPNKTVHVSVGPLFAAYSNRSLLPLPVKTGSLWDRPRVWRVTQKQRSHEMVSGDNTNWGCCHEPSRGLISTRWTLCHQSNYAILRFFFA